MPKTKKTCNYINQEPEDASGERKLPKEERKARRVLLQHNLTQLTGFARVVMRCSDNTLITVEKPEIYKLPNSETYIYFGVPRCQEPVQHAQEAAAQTFKMQNLLQQTVDDTESTSDESNDESILQNQLPLHRITDKDIDIIMTQCNVSRKKAIKTLIQHDSDLVDAIMCLTM